ncbi:FimD/PapC N-terminal domain-containing protein [Burkholderia ambifaria]|nr:FimD/PapC N-terminal domain-containing protein [Burkholderia ambifaria]WAS56796.1 FimD/PapC N-terminal domain-containing protein [Burkholderia ambifaria]
MRLDLSIPQVSMLRKARSYGSPEQWSAGEPIAMLGYNANVHNSHASGAKGNSDPNDKGIGCRDDCDIDYP